MPKKLLYRLALGALFFLNLFFLSAVIFSQVILRGEAVTVPDLTGKTVAQARSDLARKDLSVAMRGTEFSDRWEKGLIVRQVPEAGSRIRVTKVVQVVTSSGSQKVAVPDLLGKSMDNVLTLLQASGLVKGRMTQVRSPRLPAGRVIVQKPAAGVVVERNSPVGLLVSQGDEERRFVMPDLIEKRADLVMAKLKSRDFRVADIHYVYYPGLVSGIIVGQEPRQGYPVQKRSRISLEVSR